MTNNFPTVLVREYDNQIVIRQGEEKITLNLDEGQQLISLLHEALQVIREGGNSVTGNAESEVSRRALATPGNNPALTRAIELTFGQQ